MTAQNPYEVYAAEPSSENMEKLVLSLQPTINYTLNSIGAGQDPVMKAKSRTHTVRAIKSFDPTKASLKTFVSNQLKALHRENRKRKAVVPVPEREQLDKFAIKRFSEEYMDQRGAEPTSLEISEGTNLPLKRIEKMLSASRPIQGDLMPETGEELSPGVTTTDWNREATEYVYMDSDNLDRRILEGTFGLYGKPVKDNVALANELGLAPYEMSRRRMRLSKKIIDIVKDLETTVA